MGHSVLWRGGQPGHSAGLSCSVFPSLYPTMGGSTPTSPGDGPAAFSSVLWLRGKRHPTSAPSNFVRATYRHHHQGPAEQKGKATK